MELRICVSDRLRRRRIDRDRRAKRYGYPKKNRPNREKSDFVDKGAWPESGD